MNTLESQAVVKWEQLARRQKIWIAAGTVLVVIVIATISWDALKLHSEISGYEQTATKAEQEKNAALDQAAKIATQVKVREEELAKVEVKKDAKANEVKAADDAVSRDHAEYERAVKQRIPGDQVPSTDQLCQQLAAAGHPCYPR